MVLGPHEFAKLVRDRDPALSIESFIIHDRQPSSVRPELVGGLRQAQPERLGVMKYENINS